MQKALFLFFAIIFAASPTFAEIYKWTDADGKLHFANSDSLIPAEYRGKTEKRETVSPEKSNHVTKTHVKEPETESFSDKWDRERAEEKAIAKRESKSAVKKILRMWDAGQWKDLWERGTQTSKGSTSKDEFIRRLKGQETKIKLSSWRIISSEYRNTSADFLIELTFKYPIGSAQFPGGFTTTKELSFYEKEGDWKLWLYDIISAYP